MKIGKINPVEITKEMEKSYLDYAMSVIVARALPDVRDGLKPVHRRILYSMYQMGLGPTSRRTKSAKVVGECFVKDTKILTPEGLVPIQKIKIGSQVYTQDSIGQVTQLYEMPPKALLKIILKGGNTNTVTPSQKFKVLTRDWKFKWKKAKELNKNDYLVIKAGYPKIEILVKLDKAEKNQPQYLNENIAYLLGLFVSDGSIPNDYGNKKLPRVNFGLGDEKKIAEKIVSIFKKEFNYAPTIEVRNYKFENRNGEILDNKGYTIRINRKAINQFFVSNFSLEGVKAPTKAIPRQIFRSPSKIIFAFISGLIDGDGCVDVKKNRLRYVSVSKKLIDELLPLLLHLEIFGSISRQSSNKSSFVNNREVKRRYPAWELAIQGTNAVRLAKKLILASLQKRKKSQQLTKNKKRDNGFQHDIVPYAGQLLFKELRKNHRGSGWYQDINGKKFRMGIKYPTGCKIRYSSNLWEKPLRKTQIINWGLKDKLEKIGSPLSKFLNHIIENQVYFAQISSIKEAPPEKTYDLEVKTNHEFIANGVISHNCMGKYHPHGDAAIYDALVRMAQDFSMRYPLVSGQGNFGSVDGDPQAAMRYTEVKLAPISQELLFDLEKETVEFTDNFDATLKEPLFLPAKLPNALLMGAEGIAVGMATKIPPHNLNEVVVALIYMIDRSKIPEKKAEREEKEKREPAETAPKFESGVTTEELLKFIKGPDFPTGGEIYDAEEIHNAYATGRGKIIVRGQAEIEEKGKKFAIIITEIPYQVNKANLVAKVAQLVRDKRLKGIADIRDESDRSGIRVVIELKRGSRPKAILNNLYEHTPLQTTFPANFVVLVDKVPKTLNLKQILTYYIRHRQEVVVKRSIFELKRARARAHILEGLKIALKFLDAVIETIKKSRDTETAKANLIKKFKLSEIQAQAILDMQLKRLARLEQQKIEDEYQMVQETIAYLTDLLAHPKKILRVIKTELRQVAKKHGDERRTKVFPQKLTEFKKADLVPKGEVIITTTNDGYIKRVPVETYKIQRRGGKGVIGMTTKEQDEIDSILTASTHDEILFFTNTGRVFSQKAYELPEGSRQSKGQAVVNIIDLQEGETVAAILPIKSLEQKGFFLMATEKGRIKKTSISGFANIRSTGIIAIKLNKGDKLRWVKPTHGDDQVMLVTAKGMSISFSEKDARPMGRTAAGVKGIRLKKGDFLVGMGVFPGKPKKPKDKRRKFFQDILIVGEKGLGKRTPVSFFPQQKRGGVGVKVAKIAKKTGPIIASQLVTPKDNQVVLTSRLGQVIKLPLKNIPQLGRNTQGVILMRFADKKDSVAAMTTI